MFHALLAFLLLPATTSSNTATKCCHWSTNPTQCTGFDGPPGIPTGSWLCPLTPCLCEGPHFIPASWEQAIARNSLVPATSDEPGGTIANGYVGAWAPRGLPGSAGAATTGVEHVSVSARECVVCVSARARWSLVCM